MHSLRKTSIFSFLFFVFYFCFFFFFYKKKKPEIPNFFPKNFYFTKFKTIIALIIVIIVDHKEWVNAEITFYYSFLLIKVDFAFTQKQLFHQIIFSHFLRDFIILVLFVIIVNLGWIINQQDLFFLCLVKLFFFILFF